MSRSKGWIGVDLDATLAQYNGWQGPTTIGPPVPKMLERVKAWLAAGHDVRILTARGTGEGEDRQAVVEAVARWCLWNVGQELPVTDRKDYEMVELWDDRAVQVVPNTGMRADGVQDLGRLGAGDRPTFDMVFMDFARSLSHRSTCARLSVGCVVVTSDNHRILSMGYNGSYMGGPNECDSDVPGQCGCIHAEDNCLIKMNFNEAAPKKMYVTTAPCLLCAKRIVNAKISEVVYLKEYRKTEGIDLLARAGVSVRKHA